MSGGQPEDFPSKYYFPLPIGGIPDHTDFIPSLFFIACYLAPFILAIRKALTPGKRTVITINSTFMPLERMIALSFRAIMSRDNTLGEDSRKNWAMYDYTQASTGLSSFALLEETSWLLNCLCLLATRENVPFDEWREQWPGGVQRRARAEERQRIRSQSMWFSFTVCFFTSIQWTVPALSVLATFTPGAVKWLNALRFIGHGSGAGYALAIVLESIRAEREVASIQLEHARTFKRQSMMIFLVFTYRSLVSFTSTNDLTHPTNDPLATISKAFFYIAQLPLELAICWNHASTDYRKVVDTGALGDLPRKALENGKKWPTMCLKDIIVSKLLRFRRQHREPVPDSASGIIPLTRAETPMPSQTSTLVSTDAGDLEKQSVLSIPSASSRSSTVRSSSTDSCSTYLIEKMENDGKPSVSSLPLVDNIRIWTPRRLIWDW